MGTFHVICVCRAGSEVVNLVSADNDEKMWGVSCSARHAEAGVPDLDSREVDAGNKQILNTLRQLIRHQI